MQTQTLNTNKYTERLSKLETELSKLKKSGVFNIPKINISLKGALKGVKITEKDIKAARQSLFKKIKI